MDEIKGSPQAAANGAVPSAISNDVTNVEDAAEGLVTDMVTAKFGPLAGAEAAAGFKLVLGMLGNLYTHRGIPLPPEFSAIVAKL